MTTPAGGDAILGAGGVPGPQLVHTTSQPDDWTPSPRQQARESARRRATRRSATIAASSTLAFGLVVGFGISQSSGWPRVRQSFFNVAAGRAALPDVARGLLLNLQVLAICAVFVLVFGMLIAVARTTRGPVTLPLRILAAAYTDLFRGLPFILVLLLVGFGVPGLRLQGLPTGPAFLGGVALTLTYSAYVAEVFRAGIEAVHPSQRAASRSLGLSYAKTLRFVVLPQAVRRVTAPLLNDLVSLQKDTGLISVLGAIDAVRAAQIDTAQTANFTPYVVAGALFVALTIPVTRLTDALTARSDRRRAATGAL